MANKLGMTENQMIEEIEVMRGLEKYLIKTLGMEHYKMLCQGFAKERSAEMLKQLGASEEEIDAITEQVEKEVGWSTEKQ